MKQDSWHAVRGKCRQHGCLHRQPKLWNNSYISLLNWQASLPLTFQWVRVIRNCNVHSYNTRKRNDMHLPKPKLTLGKRTFRYSGALHFNNLPTTIKEATSFLGLGLLKLITDKTQNRCIRKSQPSFKPNLSRGYQLAGLSCRWGKERGGLGLMHDPREPNYAKQCAQTSDNVWMTP